VSRGFEVSEVESDKGLEEYGHVCELRVGNEGGRKGRVVVLASRKT